MAAEGGQRYELGRLILDYLRTFMWPVIVVGLAICQTACNIDPRSASNFDPPGRLSR